MYRVRNGELEVLLVHPGGPFWKAKDAGAWTIPKGEMEQGEDALKAARREFAEELGFMPEADFMQLSPIRQKGGKVVHAWAFEGNCDPAAIKSNTFEMEWPPRSGRRQQFPEVDAASFFSLREAAHKINPAQAALLAELTAKLAR